MNRNLYRLVRNASSGLWTPVAEWGRGRTKGRPGALAACALAGLAFQAACATAGSLPVPCAAGACGTSTAAVPDFAASGAHFGSVGQQATVSQIAEKAILNWQGFNVGSGHTVTFQRVQDLATLKPVGGAEFSTLNRIWQADPSVIAGRIKVADGQKGNLVFINQNGIVFAGTAQVDANTLTASSLNMPDRFFLSALTPPQNTDAQFEGSGGFVKVLEGARISAARGGRVLLLAPTVTNRGEIATPDGQAILAAGTKAYLTASSDPNLRGLLIEVDSPAGLAGHDDANGAIPSELSLDGIVLALTDGYDHIGNATNLGTIHAGTGNATLAGFAVNQVGRVSATTSVLFNGSIHLTAKDTKTTLLAGDGTTVTGLASTRAGRVRIGEGSRTAILPELDESKVQAARAAGRLEQAALDAYYRGDADAEAFAPYMATGTILDAQPFKRSQVRIVGQDIRVESEALIRAPAGELDFYAVDNPSHLRLYNPASNQDPFATARSAESGAARLQFAPGARADVAGLGGIEIPAARNVLQVTLRGDELKDSPINREGPLRGEKVWVDITRGSPLVANLADYAGGIDREIAEHSTAAGTVRLRSQGELIVPAGVSVDVSGGYIDFTPGMTKRTLLGANGILADMASASPEVRYDGSATRLVASYGRWGVTEVHDAAESYYDPGYRQGKDAGSVEILARRAVFDGTVIGRTNAGISQIEAPPAGALLKIGAPLDAGGGLTDNVLMQAVSISERSNLPAGFRFGEALSGELRDSLRLPAGIIGGAGANRLELYSNEPVSIDRPMRTEPFGSVRIAGKGIQVNADVRAPSGTLGLSGVETITIQGAGTPDVALAAGVDLDVSGIWVNDWLTQSGIGAVRSIHGGDISVATSGDLVLGTDSRFDVTGGAYLAVSGKLGAGNGGDLDLSFLDLRPASGGSAIDLDKHVRSASPGNGGRLTLTASAVELGVYDPANLGRVRIVPGFFRQGFASYAIEGLTGMEVLPGTQIDVRLSNRDVLARARAAATGTELEYTTVVVERDAAVRKAASLSLKAGVFAGATSALRVSEGASLTVDPGANVTLAGSSRVDILGAIRAPAGDISATLSKSLDAFPYVTSDAIWLGPNAIVSTAGIAEVYPDGAGRQLGDVLPAGDITLNAVTGYIVAEPGALVDLSGASPVRLDLPNSAGGLGVIAAGDAGRLTIAAREGMAFEATIHAAGGNALARSGSYALVLGSKETPSQADKYPANERILDIGGSGPARPDDLDELSGRGHVDWARLERAGFDRFELKSLDRIRFQDDLRAGAARALPLASVRLDAPNLDVNGHDVQIAAWAVQLGNYDPDRQSATGAAIGGSGRLAASASHLELVGQAVWSGASQLSFRSETELRLTGVRATGSLAQPVGSLVTTSNVDLAAATVAPTTLTRYTVQTPGDVTVSAAGTPIVPYSALGEIAIRARNITQSGNLRAPYGLIELNAENVLRLTDGSFTSVGGADGVIPFGLTVNGRSWIYDTRDGYRPTFKALPRKAVRIEGADVQLQAGAVVDISGRGELQSWEFTPGPGGSTDVLAAAGAYAVLPGYSGAPAPSDPQNAVGFDQAVGASVWLEGADGLPAGTYTLLPAHYALLPEGYLIDVGGAVKDLLPGSSIATGTGGVIVAGYLTDGRNESGRPRDARYSGFTLLPRQEVLRRSEITLTSASAFFSGDELGGRPGDSGLLSIQTRSALALNAALEAANTTGRGAAVDISAARLAVVVGSGSAGHPDAVRLDLEALSALGADSLLLGGMRSAVSGKTVVSVGAKSVELDGDAQHPLRAREVILTAQETMRLYGTSRIEAVGTGDPAGTYVVEGDGVFLRAATSEATLERTGGTPRLSGELRAEAGVSVLAAGSLMLDATKENVFLGSYAFDAQGQATAGSLILGASRIGFGDTPAGTEGLMLSQAKIEALGKVAKLGLRSYSSIDFFGDITLGTVTYSTDANGVVLLDGTGDPIVLSYDIDELTVLGAGVRGWGSGDQTARIQARNLTIANPDGIGDALPTSGSGRLRLVTDTLTLRSGAVAFRGFESVDLHARGEVLVTDSGTANLAAGAVTIRSPRLRTGVGADYRLTNNVGGIVLSGSTQPRASADASAPGGRLTLDGVRLDIDTMVEALSGELDLVATGVAGDDDLILRENARILATGAAVEFFDQTRHAPAGIVRLISTGGSVRSQAGSLVDVSATGDGDAGSVEISARETAAISGRLRSEAAAAARGGSMRLEADYVNEDPTAGANDFDRLNTVLEAGGFRGERSVLLRKGDIELSAGQVVATRRFSLTAGEGGIGIHGAIDASGIQAGQIALHAATGISLHDGASLDAGARGHGEQGGRIDLSTDGDAAGALTLGSGSRVELGGGDGGAGGVLHLRAKRSSGHTDINIAAIGSDIAGARSINAEGFATYTDTSITSADFGTSGSIYKNAAIFMSNTGAMRSRVGMDGNPAFRLLPGVELRSAGQLTLENDWSLHAWRYDPDDGSVAPAAELASGLDGDGSSAGTPLGAGVLTLRAGTDLVLNATLSDGFGGTATGATLQGRDSWSFRLVSGADLESANPLAVRPGAGDFVLRSGKLVRSGTGDISIAAGKDIHIGKPSSGTTYSRTSVIYTAGRSFEPAVAFTVPDGAAFSMDGGDIDIHAYEDIVAPTTNQLYSNWLFRQGQTNSAGEFDAANPQTAWWIRFDQFQQGVGALGGGDVRVSAGGDIANLSVSSATNAFMAAPRPDPAGLSIQGGGDVEVDAGGDILGGQYWSGRGTLALRAGRAIASGQVVSGKPLYTVIALSASSADVRAGGDVDLQAIIDPLLVVQRAGTAGVTNVRSVNDSRWTLFSSQDETTAASLQSLFGDVRLHNVVTSSNATTAGLQTAFNSLNWNVSSILYSSVNPVLALAPGSVRAVAYAGDIEILNNMTMRPAANGALELLAGRDVTISGSANTLVMSDMDLAALPAATGLPTRSYQLFPQFLPSYHALRAVHQDDVAPALIYAAGGDANGKTNTRTLIVPKAVHILAAGDISNVSLDGQNLRDSDVTLLRAGADIVFDTQDARSPNARIWVGGPGLLEIEAGHTLDLGTSEGIVTRGDLDNPALAKGGADIHIAVGVKGGVDYDGAIERLTAAIQAAMSAGGKLDAATLWQVRWLTGDDTIEDAASALAAVQYARTLPEAERRSMVRTMFFTALRDTGRDRNDPASEFAGDYRRGYRTIELLFPGVEQADALGRSLNYPGEFNLFASRVKTERGGDIEFLVPGGQAVIGLAQLAANLTPAGANVLGVVAVGEGAVRGFAREDVLVNQSRILTVGGGDILLWSSEADIDAGKGKRTSTAVPPPIIKIDPSGNVTVELQGVATGSGIGALSGQPGIVPGDVDLIAPKGAVNAGDAGIRAGNLNIAAQIVVNAENIQVSGTTTGAPVADTSGLSAGLAGNSSLGADQAIEDATRSIADNAATNQQAVAEASQALAGFRPSFITVEVLGFGTE